MIENKSVSKPSTIKEKKIVIKKSIDPQNDTVGFYRTFFFDASYLF
jgi:hypothetical protein